MLREVAVKKLRIYGGMLAPVALVVGYLVVFLIPLTNVTKSFSIDENAIGQMQPSLPWIQVPALLDYRVPGPRRLVRGKRSAGAEVIAVYVNSDYNASVALANIMMNTLTGNEAGMGCDVMFFFVKGSQAWPTTRSYTRAAIVVNVSSLYTHSICLDVLGHHGLQPNQDLFVTVLRHLSTVFRQWTLCQVPGADESNNLKYYIRMLEASVRLPFHPQPWHHIPTRGISTIGFSTNDNPIAVSALTRDLAAVLIGTVTSLNGLEEAFHHSSFVWIPVNRFFYIPFDIVQFGIFLFAGSMLSTGYYYYQKGAPLAPDTTAVMLVTTPVVYVAFTAAGLPGCVLLILALINHASRREVGLAWTGTNLIAIMMLEALQPFAGLLAGAGVATQIIFLHPLLSRSCSCIAFGTALSWLVYYYLTWHLEIPIWSANDVSDLYISLFALPNAVLVTSRLLRLHIGRE